MTSHQEPRRIEPDSGEQSSTPLACVVVDGGDDVVTFDGEQVECPPTREVAASNEERRQAGAPAKEIQEP